MASYNTSDLKKGLKILIDRDPYLIVGCNFVKPGKGQALYKLRLKNLLRQTVMDRTYKSGESLEAADVRQAATQFIYREDDGWVYMDNETYDQNQISDEKLGDDGKWIMEGMNCDVVFFNGEPIQVVPPNHVVYAVKYTEPAARGNTASALTNPVELETGAVVNAPAFIENGDLLKIDTRTGEYLERVKER